MKIKKAIKIVILLSLLYAILMLLIDGIFSLLSLDQKTNTSALIEDKLIPYGVSISSMSYCIIQICKNALRK